MRLISTLFLVILISCSSSQEEYDNILIDEKKAINSSLSKNIPFLIISQYPHDTTSFTEGFVFKDGVLYESTGSPDDMPQTESIVGPVNMRNGRIKTKIKLNKGIYFGEGITFLNKKLFHLTYKNKLGFIYDSENFKLIGKFNFASEEGWGLTTDGIDLIMSDGTSTLTFLNPTTFNIKTLKIKENGQELTLLNELEYINGYIYANVYTTNRVIKIDPNSGNVVAFLDLSQVVSLAKSEYSGSMELNGIAFDSLSNKVLITGKMWSKIYEIKFEF